MHGCEDFNIDWLKEAESSLLAGTDGWGTSPISMGISHKSYLNWRINYPIGSMYGIYGNMDPINIPPMLAYIPAPWILWVLTYDSFWSYLCFCWVLYLFLSPYISWITWTPTFTCPQRAQRAAVRSTKSRNAFVLGSRSWTWSILLIAREPGR